MTYFIKYGILSYFVELLLPNHKENDDVLVFSFALASAFYIWVLGKGISIYFFI